MKNVKIKKGSLLIYRIFDIAEEINMPKVEEILRDNRGPDQFKVPKFIDRGLIMKSRPVSFGLGAENFKVKNREIQSEVLCKVRDFGVLSLIYQIPIERGTSWEQLIKLAADLEEGAEIDQLARQQVREITNTINPALKKSTEWDSFEDYIIYFIEEFEDYIPMSKLIAEVDLPSLLLAEDDVQISELTRKSVLENYYQYGENDLALVEWNSALVIEPTGGREVPDILEFALTHLMEMRYYDDLLDVKLNRIYDDIEKKRGGVLTSRFNQAYEQGSARYIEFAEFIERVENSLKVVGDFYLATIYRAATKRFRLKDWQDNVTRKMSILAQVTSLLQGEINNRRSHLLEIIIIILIAYEIIAALAKH
jgi:hypothetical protein